MNGDFIKKGVKTEITEECLTTNLPDAAWCSATETDRIVGGKPVSIEEHPFMVQVENWRLFAIWTQRCAANILTTRYLVSAASCFRESLAHPETRRIRAGSTFRNTGGVIHNVERIINHPSFGQNGFDGDISIIRLETALVYSNSIAQATIIGQGALIPDNLEVIHAGWGRPSFFGSRAEYLTDVTVRTINNEECARRYLNWPRPHTVTSNMICAGFLDGPADGTCFGDAGGPLIYNKVIIGIASWGKTCANGTYPDVSTSVGSYTNWILETAV
ncbi:Trypsin CFT-1 [Papilio machaon]|uniref:Trypsin CFT-1 n=1 Tax=Papilio machaon TaxID=76193 RepID=A0A0N1I8C7_PAPMA|nr:Trypsin CFT-1 [Papilio machaon]